MPVFKNYFKLLRSSVIQILIYLVITVVIVILATTSTQNNPQKFSEVKPKLSIINHDNKALISNSFIDYMSTKTKIIHLQNEERALKDALFFGEIDAVIVIPKNFEADFLNNKNVKLELTKVPGKIGATQIDILANKYLNIANLYVKSNVNAELLTKKINYNLDQEVKLNFDSTYEKKSIIQEAGFYFNFLNYSFLAIIILVIALIMKTYNITDIKMRNMCSPISRRQTSFEMILGNFTVTFIIWAAFIILSLIIFNEAMLTSSGLLYIFNSFIFTQVALSIAYLVGSTVKSREAHSGIANIISLGSSFLSGAFVPQMFLGSSILAFAHILPSYWYVKNNDTISNLNVDGTIFWQVIQNMGVMLIFIVVIYMITAIIKKRIKYIN